MEKYYDLPKRRGSGMFYPNIRETEYAHSLIATSKQYKIGDFE